MRASQTLFRNNCCSIVQSVCATSKSCAKEVHKSQPSFFFFKSFPSSSSRNHHKQARKIASFQKSNDARKRVFINPTTKSNTPFLRSWEWWCDSNKKSSRLGWQEALVCRSRCCLWVHSTCSLCQKDSRQSMEGLVEIILLWFNKGSRVSPRPWSLFPFISGSSFQLQVPFLLTW